MLSRGSRWEKMRRWSSVGMLVRSEFDGSEGIVGRLRGRIGLKLNSADSSYGDPSYGDSVPESDLWSSGEFVPVVY